MWCGTKKRTTNNSSTLRRHNIGEDSRTQSKPPVSAADALDTIGERSDQLDEKADAEIQHESRKAAHAQSKIDDGKVHQLEGSWERTSFKYDRPEIRVWNRDVAIPTVHVTFNNRKLAFHHPAVCTVRRTKTLKSKTEWKVKNVGFGIKTKVLVTTTWWDYTDIKGP